jgi:hypothetical protein
MWIYVVTAQSRPDGLSVIKREKKDDGVFQGWI